MKFRFDILGKINFKVLIYTILYIFIFNFMVFSPLFLAEKLLPFKYLYFANIIGLLINLILVIFIYKIKNRSFVETERTNWQILFFIFLGVLVFKISIDPILNINTMLNGGKLTFDNYEIPLQFKITKILCFSILTPIIEELFFRGIILYELLLNKKDKFFSIIYSALLFTIIHVNFINISDSPMVTIVVSFFIGLITGYLYTATRNIVYPILFHVLNNFFAFIIFNVFHENYANIINELNFDYEYWIIIIVVLPLFLFIINKTGNVLNL